MSLGKQIKLKLIDRLNKVVLPKMDFKSKVGNKFSQKFSGIVKMDKIKLYSPHGRLSLIVDVTVSGYCVVRKCFRDEEEIKKLINSIDGANMYISLYSSTSSISHTKNYNDKEKRKKMEMTSKIKLSIIDQVQENVKIMCLEQSLSNFGPISEVKIGKIKYE